jgi:hypothetical protein
VRCDFAARHGTELQRNETRRASSRPYEDQRQPYEDQRQPYEDQRQPYEDQRQPYQDQRQPYQDELQPLSGQRTSTGQSCSFVVRVCKWHGQRVPLVCRSPSSRGRRAIVRIQARGGN